MGKLCVLRMYFSLVMSLSFPVFDSIRLFQVAGVATGSKYKCNSRFVIQRWALHHGTCSVVQYRDDLHLCVVSSVQSLPQEPHNVFIYSVGTIKTLSPCHQNTNVQGMLNHRKWKRETYDTNHTLSSLRTWQWKFGKLLNKHRIDKYKMTKLIICSIIIFYYDFFLWIKAPTICRWSHDSTR